MTREQRIGASVFFVLALVVWIGYALWPVPSPDLSSLPEPGAPKRHRTWEERRDSMRHADSLRYALWAAEREQRYDSFRLADSLRRSEWKRLRQQQYDSFRLADSLWRDSVGWSFAAHPKRDTVLDLNRCDTAELQLIRGIGPFTARRIVQYREALGGYYSPGQLKDEALLSILNSQFSILNSQFATIDSLLLHFTADPADVQMIRVNTADIETLNRHPYLRYTQAKAIYTLRRKKIRLSAVDDLRALPELPDSILRKIAPYLSFE